MRIADSGKMLDDPKNATREYSSIDFSGRLRKAQKFFIASFPGKYEQQWNELIGSEAENSVHIDELISTSCVFYPGEL